MHSRFRSDFLFANPSLVSGAARLFDWYGLYDLYNSSSTPFEADYKALLSDWFMVGDDLYAAMREFESVYPACQFLRTNVANDELCSTTRR